MYREPSINIEEKTINNCLSFNDFYQHLQDKYKYAIINSELEAAFDLEIRQFAHNLYKNRKITKDMIADIVIFLKKLLYVK